MAIHSVVRFERLPKLSGSALSLLYRMSLQPHARASTRLSAHHNTYACTPLQSRPLQCSRVSVANAGGGAWLFTVL